MTCNVVNDPRCKQFGPSLQYQGQLSSWRGGAEEEEKRLGKEIEENEPTEERFDGKKFKVKPKKLGSSSY